MFIEYKLSDSDCRERGILNTDHVKWIQIEPHGGGYGYCIEVYYDGHDSIGVFMKDDLDKVQQVFDAFGRAFAGDSVTIKDIGYVRPVQRDNSWINTLYGASLDNVNANLLARMAACCSAHAGGDDECKD